MAPAVVALLAAVFSLAVGVGAFLPWLLVAFDGAERPLRGWDLGGDARACLALAAAGALAGLVVGRGRVPLVALAAKAVLVATGAATFGLAVLQALELRAAVGLPGLSVRTGAGLVTVVVGALGHITVGAVAPWRVRSDGGAPARPC